MARIEVELDDNTLKVLKYIARLCNVSERDICRFLIESTLAPLVRIVELQLDYLYRMGMLSRDPMEIVRQAQREEQPQVEHRQESREELLLKMLRERGEMPLVEAVKLVGLETVRKLLEEKKIVKDRLVIRPA